MNDTIVTFHGWAGSHVRHRVARDVSVATVRVAATPRLKRDGEWVDGETTWYTVTAWRGLADNLRDSVRKGDPLVVHGRLRTETWRPDEGPASTTLHVEASLIGHDLTRGMSHYIRPQRPDRAVETDPASSAPVVVDPRTGEVLDDSELADRADAVELAGLAELDERGVLEEQPV